MWKQWMIFFLTFSSFAFVSADFYWKSYNGTIPDDAFELTPGESIYYGKALFPASTCGTLGGTLVGGQVYIESVCRGYQKSYDFVEILCSSKPESLAWTHDLQLKEQAVLITSDTSNMSKKRYISKIPSKKSPRYGSTFINDGKHYFVNEFQAYAISGYKFQYLYDQEKIFVAINVTAENDTITGVEGLNSDTVAAKRHILANLNNNTKHHNNQTKRIKKVKYRILPANQTHNETNHVTTGNKTMKTRLVRSENVCYNVTENLNEFLEQIFQKINKIETIVSHSILRALRIINNEEINIRRDLKKALIKSANSNQKFNYDDNNKETNDNEFYSKTKSLFEKFGKTLNTEYGEDSERARRTILSKDLVDVFDGGLVKTPMQQLKKNTVTNNNRPMANTPVPAPTPKDPPPKSDASPKADTTIQLRHLGKNALIELNVDKNPDPTNLPPAPLAKPNFIMNPRHKRHKPPKPQRQDHQDEQFVLESFEKIYKYNLDESKNIANYNDFSIASTIKPKIVVNTTTLFFNTTTIVGLKNNTNNFTTNNSTNVTEPIRVTMMNNKTLSNKNVIATGIKDNKNATKIK